MPKKRKTREIRFLYKKLNAKRENVGEKKLYIAIAAMFSFAGQKRIFFNDPKQVAFFAFYTV